MSLFETFYEKAVLMNKTSTPSSVGGFVTTWTEGAEFDVAFSGLTPTERIAAQQASAQYSDTIVTPEAVKLSERDVFRCGGKYYRIVGVLSSTPAVATMSFNRYTVETLQGLPT